MYLRLLPDDPRVRDGQPVQEVHHDDHDEEDEGQEEEVADGGLEGKVGKLELADEHGEGFDDAQAEGVEEGVVGGGVGHVVVVVQEDVEAEGEREDE